MLSFSPITLSLSLFLYCSATFHSINVGEGFHIVPRLLCPALPRLPLATFSMNCNLCHVSSCVCLDFKAN